MKFGYCCLLAAALFLAGCGGAEKKEAVSFYKLLTKKSADFAATNGVEKELLNNTKSWAENITTKGGGKGKQLDENAATATAASQALATVSQQLGQLRQAVSDQAIEKEYVQGVRGNLVKQIQTRQRMIQDLRTALDSSATDFKGFAQTRSYTGDSYPAGIDKINTLLRTYHGPDDVVAKASEDLKTKYEIVPADLGG